MESLLQIATDCKNHGTIGRVNKPLTRALDNLITDESVARSNTRLQVAVTRMWPDFRSHLLINEFKDREDLLMALICSCFIPFYMAPSLSVRWRRGRYVDGGFRNIVPILPSYVMVIPFQPAFLTPVLSASVRRSRDLISPSLNPNFPYSMPWLLRRAFMPASDAEIQALFDWGMTTGFRWADLQAQSGAAAAPSPTGQQSTTA